MNANKEQILNSINSMKSVCDKGKKEIRALVESIIGEPLEPPLTWNVGDVFESPNISPVVILQIHNRNKVQGDDKIFFLGGSGGAKRGNLEPWSASFMNAQELTDYLLKYQAKKVGKFIYQALDTTAPKS